MTLGAAKDAPYRELEIAGLLEDCRAPRSRPHVAQVAAGRVADVGHAAADPQPLVVAPVHLPQDLDPVASRQRARRPQDRPRDAVFQDVAFPVGILLIGALHAGRIQGRILESQRVKGEVAGRLVLRRIPHPEHVHVFLFLGRHLRSALGGNRGMDLRVGEQKNLDGIGVPGHVDLAAERVVVDHRRGVLDVGADVEVVRVVHHRAADRVRRLARLVQEHQDRARQIPVVKFPVKGHRTGRRNHMDFRVVRLIHQRHVGLRRAGRQHDSQSGRQWLRP